MSAHFWVYLLLLNILGIVLKMKILHIFTVNELKFSIAMIENGRRDSENIHNFFIQFPEILDKIDDNNDLIIDFKHTKKISSIINKYSKEYDYFFIHGFHNYINALFIKRCNLKKIVWRTWGGDAGYEIIGSFSEKIVKRIVNRIFAKRMSIIKLIGIANCVDEINLRNHGINNKTLRMPYHKPGLFQIEKYEMHISREHDGINIMIGHSGYSICNHYQIINKLKPFFSENIRIFLILSYGDPDYIDKLKKQVECMKTDKIIIISSFLDQTKYNALLHSMDIAIFDGTISYALGNITKLLMYRKKIFLCNRGVIAQAFDLKGIPYGDVDKLGEISFEEFKENVMYTNDMLDDFAPQSFERNEECWNRIYGYLKCSTNE